jgi:hypothetical protein
VKTATTLKYSFEDFISSKFHFVKQIVGGIFVTIAMVGLDQDLMQKNLVVPPLAKLKKHVHFTGIFVVINIFFLSVGLLYIYAAKNGIEVPTDLVTGKPEPICFSLK